MSLASGTRLGPYEIVAPIGAGGMGEVYRVRDIKLKREVALKVLPDGFAQDAERMARFEREACVLAALNHPNIAHIYSVEERALVMELVEGETLSGPLPVETALNYARQIAQALEYAHEKGVIHRDLKPANIKVTPEGVVKLLDFGLAKAIEDPAGPADDPSVSPTLTLGATRVGMIMGTAAYMSPEQASGKTADRRADTWSFGAVLYEMLAGKKAFEGESISDTLASVLKLDPDWDALPAPTPASIRKLVRRCLTKDRKQRLQAIGEARIAIDEAQNGVPQDAVTERGVSRHSTGPWVAAVVLGAVAAFTSWFAWRATRLADHPLVRLDVDLGADIALPVTSGGSSVTISPDGTRLAYASGTPTKLFIRRLDQSKATELRGTEEATRPFFSPDGLWVGFLAGSRLNKVSVEGGAVIPLGDFPNFAGASWGEDGSILVSGAFSKGLMRIPAGGGPPETVEGLGNGELALALPQILPGGKAILFAAAPTFDPDTYTIEVFTLADRHRKIVARGGATPRYLGTSNGAGHLIYVNREVLFAIPFDLDKLETRGTPVPILDDVAYESTTRTGQFNFSRTGTLVYRRTSRRRAHKVDGAMGRCNRQERAAAGQAWRLSESKPFTRWQAGSADSRRERQSGRLGLRPPTGRHDALDFWRYTLWFPNLEPGRPIRRFLAPRQRHLPGSCGWSQPAESADADQECSGSAVIHAGWKTAGLS